MRSWRMRQAAVFSGVPGWPWAGRCRLGRGAAAEGPVWPDGVVVGGEAVELGLELGG